VASRQDTPDETDEEVVGLERRGWEALSSGPRAATTFYGEVLAEDVLFVLPGGMLLDDRRAALESMAGTPWSSFELHEVRVVRLAEGCRTVAYRARAVREDVTYEAIVASTYVRHPDGWRLALHQQTPV
jgi:hypothetical protein